MTKMNSINFLLCGVGGQGTILASDVLVNVGLTAGYQTKQAEVHGMSQRGGSVTSHVRWGRQIHSPLTGAGEVDVLLAFEKLEALRNIIFLRKDSLALVNTQIIEPLTVISGNQVYPDDDTIREAFGKLTSRVVYIDGEKIARSLENIRTANVVLLGALSALLERDAMIIPDLTAEIWLQVITERVPKKLVDLNSKAFLAGRSAMGNK
jgi:indolepyruvate ferredoxin oxidoreductase beta subunit